MIHTAVSTAVYTTTYVWSTAGTTRRSHARIESESAASNCRSEVEGGPRQSLAAKCVDPEDPERFESHKLHPARSETAETLVARFSLWPPPRSSPPLEQVAG